MFESTETISVYVDRYMIQKTEFQEYIKKLERSQHVTTIIYENHGMIIIHGQKLSVQNSKLQIQKKIEGKSSKSTIELSDAKNKFLESFGQKILSTIREKVGIDRADIVAGKLQLSGTDAAITNVKTYLEKNLYEKNATITDGMKQHLEKTCKGRLWKEFSERHRVGASFQEVNLLDKNKRIAMRNKGIRSPRRGEFSPDRGRGGRGYSHKGRLTPNRMPDLGNLNLNDNQANANECNNDEEKDGDDDTISQASDSDTSLFDILDTKNFDDLAQQPITVALCSDSSVSLSNAILELQSYFLHTELWAITEDELKFILKQQQRGKPMKNNMTIRERSIQIKYYLSDLAQNSSVHIYVFYKRGMWYVRVIGFKSDAHSAVFKIQSYLNDVVDTEVQIPISGAMAFFLKRKASSEIDRLGSIHKIKIIIFSPPRNVGNINKDDKDNHCLKLIGPVSRTNLAQTKVQDFLETLSEREEDFPCDTWDNSRNISLNIKTFLIKILGSHDYEAAGFVKFFNLPIERRQTKAKVTVTIVGINEETANDIIQQCKDFVEGYDVWKPSLDIYRALHNILIVQRQPNIQQFQQEWGTVVQLENQTNTVIIPARSKIIAEEIREALQNLVAGNTKRCERISMTISIESSDRRFIYPAIQPLLNEARTQKVFVDSKNRNGLTLHGRSEVVTEVQRKINATINDIKQKIVISHLKLPFVESELMRTNSYETIKGIERETNTNIRDVKSATKNPQLNVNNDSSLTITCVVNNRGQKILVKKGDITKVKDVDAIINAANGPLNHAGGVDKAISDAAGPALDEECRQLIANNGGVAISTGTAVKTTAGRLPYKSVIHAIGPQYSGGNQQERPLLFFCVLSSLRMAEQEGYKSIALPAISSATYGFPLKDCTNIVIRAVKHFFADFPQSQLREVILLDIDDAACNSFAREVVNDHTSTTADGNDDIMSYTLTPLTANWRWEDNDGEKNSDTNHIRQIEAAFQQYLKTSVPSKLKIYVDNLATGLTTAYSIHFLPNLPRIIANNPNALQNRLVCGYQLREDTKYTRDIIRYPLTSQPQTTSVEYKPKPLDKYHLNVQYIEDEWDIIGINYAALKQAEIAIKKAIASVTISEPFSVYLSEDIDVHKTAISNIAIQQFIQVTFQQDSNGNLLVTLKGFKQHISEAKLQISLYVQDILRMKADKDDELNIPKEWGDQEETCKLVELQKNDPDFIRIEKRIKETISNIKIDKIERIQNLRLWNHYAIRRQILRQELSDKPNLQIEMELFHGTRTTSPKEIYDGEYGFDMTFCTNGLWGLGTYFAVNAAYSCGSYSYQLSDGKRQVFLAQVLTGEVFDYKDKTEQHYVDLQKRTRVHQTYVTTVYPVKQGSSKVYIIYENRIAYPAFLITFNP